MDNGELGRCWEEYLGYLRERCKAHQDQLFAEMSPVGFTEWLANKETAGNDYRLPECDSEYCIFNPKGYCCIPLVYAKQPELDEDGCKDFICRSEQV